MGMAFEITEDDLLNIASQAGAELSRQRAEEILGLLDHHMVEIAALHYDDLDEQTHSAYEEIRCQIQDLGLSDEVLKPASVSPKSPGVR